MAFCKFSTKNQSNGEVLINSAFFVDYMPYAPESCTKVYLYGLQKCYSQDLLTNTIEDFCTTLNLSQEDVKSAFLYWQDQGLVKVLNISPIEVRYLPIVEKRYIAKTFEKDKYEEFNRSIQEIIDGRMITPFEYKEYYYTMESLHLDQSALIMIAKFCTGQKGPSVGYSYILTIAKNWAYEGVHTAKDVERKLMEMEGLTSKVKDVLVALKSKKSPSYEDKTLFEKWTKNYGYNLDTLIHIAKQVKRGGMEKLSLLIENYYSLKLFSSAEIDDYEHGKEELKNTAKTVCQSLGLFYDNLDPVINTYILKWKQMGYSADAIKLVADICFKKYIRNFEQMDEIISKYYSNGLVSIQAINDYISGTLSIDKKIKKMLENLGLSRQVTSWDRNFYHTWTYSWGFADDVIDYALSLAVDKTQPITYVNKILSNWKEQNIKTLQQAKNSQNMQKNTQKTEKIDQKQPEFLTHSFSSEELNALFDNLDEVKLIWQKKKF